MFGIRLHLPLFDQSAYLPELTRLVVTSRGQAQTALLCWYDDQGGNAHWQQVSLSLLRGSVVFQEGAPVARDLLYDSQFPGYAPEVPAWRPFDPLPFGNRVVHGTVTPWLVSGETTESIRGCYLTLGGNDILAGCELHPLSLFPGRLVPASIVVT